MASVTPRSLHWVDIVLFIFTLAVSLFLGSYHTLRRKKNTTEQYLIGGREVKVLPASISLMVSHLSAVTLLGNSMESYFYGITFSIYLLTHLFSVIFVAFVVAPMLQPLKITTAQEVSFI